MKDMTRKNRAKLLLSVLLPGIALVAFLGLPNPVFAQNENDGYFPDPNPNTGGACDCTYAGQCYSIGACVQSVCAEGSSQKCSNGGSWGACGSCL